MKFAAKTDKELESMGLLSKGEYDFDVLKASDEISKEKGNEMIKLTLAVYPLEGDKVTVFDYLLEAMSFKLKHFCDSVGLSKEYAEGHIMADMCVSRSGRCKLDVQGETKEYPAKNVVKDYCPIKVKEQSEAFDDIPF